MDHLALIAGDAAGNTINEIPALTELTLAWRRQSKQASYTGY